MKSSTNCVLIPIIRGVRVFLSYYTYSVNKSGATQVKGYEMIKKKIAPKNGGNPGAKTIDKILNHLGYEVNFVKSKSKKRGGEKR